MIAQQLLNFKELLYIIIVVINCLKKQSYLLLSQK